MDEEGALIDAVGRDTKLGLEHAKRRFDSDETSREGRRVVSIKLAIG